MRLTRCWDHWQVTICQEWICAHCVDARYMKLQDILHTRIGSEGYYRDML